MRWSRLLSRSLRYYWRTNLAVTLGVATAVAVLAGALLVGDSVRGSLRDLVLERLGRTNHAIVSIGFFREALADDVRRHEQFSATFADVVPIVAIPGVSTNQNNGRRAGGVRVYGVDDRFWRFHAVDGVVGPADREAFVSPALAREIEAEPEQAILVRVQRPSAVPLESLHGRKDDVGRTLRLTVRAILPTSALGDFSIEATQNEVRAVFVPLARLQQELEVEGRVNTLLVSSRSSAAAEGAAATTLLTRLVRSAAALDDVGMTVRTAASAHAVVVGSEAGLLDRAQAELAARASEAIGMSGQPVFTYLANTMRVGDREVPYSLVSALDLRAVPVQIPASGGVPAPIVLNAWAAADLNARPGDMLTLEYFVWEDPGQLITRSTEFQVAGVVPIEAGDRDLAPVFPGISDSPTLSDWDPPFPIDLRRVRKQDEEYWDRYRTTPKAFVPLDVGQQLWGSRYGELTSLRVTVDPGQSLEDVQARYTGALRAELDPLALGMVVRDVRADGLAASRGATDFGEYFVYFSFFIVVSALLLAALFFKLGIEQRIREVGLLRAVGCSPAAVRRLFTGEALVLSVAGSALGVAGAVGYAALIMAALRSWWVDAVGTTALTLHVTSTSLAIGALGGIAAAVVCIWWTLRSLARVSERSLLAGQLPQADAEAWPPESRAGGWLSQRPVLGALVLAVLGAGLIAAAMLGAAAGTGAFFGAGAALLGASLCAASALLRRHGHHGIAGRGWWSVSLLGVRSTTYRPGRSVLSIAVVAAATFILISVDAFRRDAHASPGDRHSGTGGYSLLLETLLPIAHDPNTSEGRTSLNLGDLDRAVSFEPFRLRPGDDASCLNLYEPQNPRILAPRDSFLQAGRFSFQSSLGSTDAERANPWLLLQRPEPDGAIPVIADANSMTYVLHRALGDDLVITQGSESIRLRLVAALRDSIFQGELIMSQANFLRLFPGEQGYRVMLVDAPAANADAITTQLEDALADYGADAVSTAARLAEFHRVENTYLSTFQTLGALGLLLGTAGLATVLLRNVLERRRELALLAAVGYRRLHFTLMLVAENTVLLAAGLGIGALCAALAIAPAISERGGRLPMTTSLALLLFAVFVTGVLSSLLAMRAATHAPLLDSLRSE